MQELQEQKESGVWITAAPC